MKIKFLEIEPIYDRFNKKMANFSIAVPMDFTHSCNEQGYNLYYNAKEKGEIIAEGIIPSNVIYLDINEAQVEKCFLNESPVFINDKENKNFFSLRFNYDKKEIIYYKYSYKVVLSAIKEGKTDVQRFFDYIDFEAEKKSYKKRTAEYDACCSNSFSVFGKNKSSVLMNQMIDVVTKNAMLEDTPSSSQVLSDFLGIPLDLAKDAVDKVKSFIVEEQREMDSLEMLWRNIDVLPENFNVDGLSKTQVRALANFYDEAFDEEGPYEQKAIKNWLNDFCNTTVDAYKIIDDSISDEALFSLKVSHNEDDWVLINNMLQELGITDSVHICVQSEKNGEYYDSDEYDLIYNSKSNSFTIEN